MDNETLDEVPAGFDVVEVVDADEDIEGDEVEVEVDATDDDQDEEPRSSARRESATERQASGPTAREIELQRELDQIKRRDAERENEAAWQKRFTDINAEFRRAKANIKQLAQNDDDPLAFVDREMDRLISWRDQEIGKYFGSRERAKDDQIRYLSIPQYAESLVKEFKLRKSDLDDLRRFEPNEMRVRAMTLAEFRKQDATVATRNKTAAQRSREGFSAGGRGQGNIRRVKKGSDNHLLALLGEPLIQ